MPDDNPFLARPDEHAVGAANEVYCWLPGSDSRECNATCVAYDPDNAREGRPCEALNHLGVIIEVMKRRADMMKRLAREQEVEKIKEAIDKIPPPPEVR